MAELPNLMRNPNQSLSEAYAGPESEKQMHSKLRWNMWSQRWSRVWTRLEGLLPNTWQWVSVLTGQEPDTCKTWQARWTRQPCHLPLPWGETFQLQPLAELMFLLERSWVSAVQHRATQPSFTGKEKPQANRNLFARFLFTKTSAGEQRQGRGRGQEAPVHASWRGCASEHAKKAYKWFYRADARL